MTSQTLSHPYVGMWETTDGRIRHQLLPNGRYDEARGSRESAYRGRYEPEIISSIGMIPALRPMAILLMTSCTMPEWFSIASSSPEMITPALSLPA